MHPGATQEIAPTITDEHAQRVRAAHHQAMDEYGIDTPLARPLPGPNLHETDGFKTLREYGLRQGVHGAPTWGTEGHQRTGVTYKGRGAIQLTGP